MRFLLIALVGFLILSTVFGFDPGPAPGLKIKNALLYAIMMALLLRVTLDRSYRIQLPAIPIIFGVLIGYALLTYVAILLVVEYPGYDWLRQGFYLKNSLFDQMLFFLVFFYGLRSQEEAVSVLKILVACWALSHVIAVFDAIGLMHVGDIQQRSDGRVQGAIGESNQYGALVALSLPVTASLILVTRGAGRLFWLAATAVCAVTLLMTVSRGAFVGATCGAVAGLYLFRRYVRTGKVLALTGIVVIAAVLAISAVIALGFGDLLYGRMLGNARMGGDLEGVSSGRTEIWATAIAAMWQKPLTLITGYGWAMYTAMPFRSAAHNHYLSHWFNLGLPGLICCVLLIVLPIKYARAAALVAGPDVRPMLIAFVVAAIATATAVFFVELFLPWLYYWAYAGIMMRIAVNTASGTVTQPVAVAASERVALGLRRDANGWTGAASR